MTVGQGLGLLPAPVAVQGASQANFELYSGAVIFADTKMIGPARLFSRYLQDGCGLLTILEVASGPHFARRTVKDSPVGSVRFVQDETLKYAYALSITAKTNQTPGGIEVLARDTDGAFAAVATLRQLAGEQAFRLASTDTESLAFPALRITDSPRFGWRGVLLDVARHFMPKSDVLRFIDLAASHKFNILHLHLTDDQGWRVEIKRYPKLTEAGAWRTESNVGPWRFNLFDGRPHGGFYTQDDLREIVAYAAARGVTVLPEIDVPGHIEAAIAAYPELGCHTPDKSKPVVRTSWGVSQRVLQPNHETVAFFKNVFDEVMDIFPGQYIGLGGDEVPPLLWREDQQSIDFAASVGLVSVNDLHGWFLGQLADYVVTAGRRPVVWDEGLSEHLPQSAIITTWRGYEAGAVAMAKGHDIVLAPEQDLYLDHRAAEGDQEPIPVGFVRSLEQVYGFEPGAIALPVQDSKVSVPGTMLGIQAQLWTEHLDSPRRVDYAAYPRLCAVAEVAWSPRANRTDPAVTEEFLSRLRSSHLPRLAAAGVEFRPLEGPLPWQQRPGVAGWPRDLEKEIKESQTGQFVGGWHEGMQTEV